MMSAFYQALQLKYVSCNALCLHLSSLCHHRTTSSPARSLTVSCAWPSQWATGPVAAPPCPVSRGCRTTPLAAAPAGPGGEPQCDWLTPLFPSAGGVFRSWTPCMWKPPPYHRKRKDTQQLLTYPMHTAMLKIRVNYRNRVQRVYQTEKDTLFFQ